MSKHFAIIGLSLLGLCASLPAGAQNKTSYNGQINTITTAVPFLRISPDARSGGMGDVGIAISPDANAQYWNIGRIPFATRKYGISLSYTPWLKDLVPDIFLAYVSGFAKFGENDNQAISGSLRYFSLGDINFYDINATPTGTGKPREYSLDAGYSRRLSDYLGIGVSLRYIHSSIASGISSTPGTDYKPGNTVAGDVGIYYNKTRELDEFKKRTFAWGATITNLGGKISYSSTRKDFIPINLGLGTSYTWQFDAFNKLTAALDVNKLLVPTPQDSSSTSTPVYYYPDKSVVSGVLGSFSDAPGGFSEEMREFNFSLGLEYWYQDQFAFRGGYYWEDKTKGDRQYFTLGLGVRYNIFTLNAAYVIPSGSGVNRNPLSNTLRFTLGFDFDNIKPSESSGE